MKNALNILGAAASAAALAATDLAAAMPAPRFVERGDPLLKLYRRRGYSGDKSRPHVHENNFKRGLALTAKTHKARDTIDHISVPSDYGYDRLAMLKNRRG